MRLFAFLGCALVLAPLAAAQTPDWANAQAVEIDLQNFAFTPATIKLQRGVRYRLHIVNKAGGGHNLVAKEFFASATFDPANRVTPANGKVELRGGESADILLVANRAGMYDVHCSHFMHSTFGMKGTIAVQ